MPKRLIKYSRTQPARMIVMVISYLTAFGGLLLMTPWFHPSAIPETVSAFLGLSAPTFIGVCINFIASVPALLAVRKNQPHHIANGAFWLFIWYMFVTMTRILTEGHSLLFLPTLIITLVLAVVYLEQKSHERDENDWKF